MTRLILAEKPSMGRSIATALGIHGNQDGYIEDPAKQVVVSWSVGHLIELQDPKSYREEWGAWKWASLPMDPGTFVGQVIRSTRDQWTVVKRLLERDDITELVCATDAGREGELIFSYIYEHAGCRKPVKRLWTSSLADTAVREAYENLKPWQEFKGLQDAAKCRSEADWLVGLNLTRAISLLARADGHDEDGAWNVGRVVTPTLALLVDRELAIRNFKPKDFWTMEAVFAHPDGNYKGKWFSGDQNAFQKEVDAGALLKRLQGKPGRIVKADTKPESKPPEMLYDLTGLQKEANKRFGFSAEDTLGYAQELYEKKYLSYPRTNSRHMTEADAVKAQGWLQALTNSGEYGQFAKQALDLGKRLDKRFVDDKEVEDHSALTPTDEIPALANLSKPQQLIYDLVVRRFIAAYFPNRVDSKTTVITEIDGETFKSTGSVLVEAGWSAVDQAAQSKKAKKEKKEDAGEDEVGGQLPRITPDDAAARLEVPVRKLDSLKKQTQAPKRMTEADLLGAMQSAGKDLDDEELKGAMKDCGLGTPATRAATIEKLLDAGSKDKPKAPLVVRQGDNKTKVLVPTEKGLALIDLIPVEDIKSPELTGSWEASLEKVRRGELSRVQFMTEVRGYLGKLITEVHGAATSSGGASAGERFEAQKMDFACPRCGSDVHLKAWEGRYYVKCDAKRAPEKKCYFAFDAKDTGEPLTVCNQPGCGGRVNTTGKGKKLCADCETWQDTGQKAGGGPAPDGQEGKPCPKCKKGKLYLKKGNYGPFYACSNRDKCDLLYSVDAAGEPTGGWCQHCKGPAKKTSRGNICLLCGKAADGEGTGAAPAPRTTTTAANGFVHDPNKPPAPAKCPNCKKLLKNVWLKKQEWRRRCDDCDKWFNPAEA